MTAVALLSDIHANLPALEAVIGEIDRHRPDAVGVLGDLINGCAWPAETLELLASRAWPVLVGNHDDAVMQLSTPRMEQRYADREHYATLWWTRSRLGPAQVAFIEKLPLELTIAPPDAPAVRLVHGLPGNFFVGFRPDSPVDWSARQLAPVAEQTVAGGHTHFPMVRTIERWQVINTGSVGAPYDEDPRAAYVWLPDGYDGTTPVPLVADFHGAGGGRGIGLGETFGFGTEVMPRLAGQVPKYIEVQLKSFEQRERTNDNAIMHSIASKLTELEVKAVAAYISTLD